MKTKLTPIAAAAAVALAGAMAPAFAQSAAAPAAAASAAVPASKAEEVQRVEVTGIRGSLQQSLTQKRNADSHVEVITAEDVGKLPDKNIADSLQHVPGLTISSAGANEGGFDESDRVSMRGTGPSLTQTLINGHQVASGDWFVLDQTGTVGRSVSYTLLPSELVGSVVIHKSSQASLVEGGVAGSVDIITRKPLDAHKQFEAEASIGAVYADLPGKTDPQLSGLVNWKNEPGTFGVLLQAFSETRHLRRDGVEELGYEQIAPGSSVALAHPDLAGVWYPQSIGAALFEQTRKRTGGLIDLEIKPNTSTALDLNGFYSKLEATNYNRNYLLWGTHFINQGNSSCSYPTDPVTGKPSTVATACVGQSPNAGYVVRNNTLVSATFSPTMLDPSNGLVTPVQHGIYDQISRPAEGSETKFIDFDGDFRLSDKFRLTSKIGYTNGVGRTPSQDVLEADIKGSGGQYQLNGTNSAPSFSLPGANNTSPAGGNASLDWIFGDEDTKTIDKENWQQLDGVYDVDMGPLVSLKFGGRATDHTRQALHIVAQGPISNPTTGLSPFDNANWPQTFSNYPSNFGQNLGGSVPGGVWYYTPAQLAAFDAQYTNRDPSSREYYPHEFSVHETTNAAYLQGNLEGNKWSGDVGLRFVNTGEHVLTFQPATATTPGALTNSAFGPFVPVNTNHSYNDLLPSGNLKFDLSKTLVARVAASRTMTRADYSALAGTVSLTPPAVAGGVGSGSGGNPDLKPITSNNVDTSLEWYFADRALLSVSAFYMDLTNFIGYGQVNKTYTTFDANNPKGAQVDYLLTVPINSSGKVKGLEFAWEQPIYGNFGLTANYTYTDAKEDGGGPLVGASKNTYNLGGYFENDLLNARVSYNHRSSFYSGLDRETAFSQAAVGELSATLGVTVNKYMSVTLDGRNLNNPKLKYYALNTDQPRSIYENGRQYFLTARFKY
jgi:iron complex outermembrane receptor protein